jgi:hypothetical protein
LRATRLLLWLRPEFLFKRKRTILLTTVARNRTVGDSRVGESSRIGEWRMGDWLMTEQQRTLAIPLTKKVRFLTASQAATLWRLSGPRSAENARRRLDDLINAGLIRDATVRVHPELPLRDPILVWTPGDAEPNFGAIAYRLNIRWKEPFRAVTVYLASSKLAQLFGARSRVLKRPYQSNHDTHVAGLYVKYFVEEPEKADAWISEDVLAPSRKHQKLPDAELHFTDGRAPLVIEFGGAYRSDRLRKVHEDCLRRRIGYELW